MDMTLLFLLRQPEDRVYAGAIYQVALVNALLEAVIPFAFHGCGIIGEAVCACLVF